MSPNAQVCTDVLAVWNELIAVKFDGGLAPKKIQQDGNALAPWNHAGHQGLEPLENTCDNLCRIPGLEVGGQDFYFRVTHRRPQLGDDRIRDCGPAMAEMDDAPNAAQRLDAPQQCRQRETGKEITWEERFGHPGRTAPRRAAETDSGQEHFHVGVLPKV